LLGDEDLHDIPVTNTEEAKNLVGEEALTKPSEFSQVII
jgi:hypothetical protein